MLRLVQALLDIRYSLWFIPTVMVAAGILLAVLAVDFDTRIGDGVLADWPRLFGASADGARAMLQMVAGAMITVAGLTFSITVLLLSLGASQYTPRVIRTFMGSRPTQMVLGVFVGIFAYSVVVLRTIRGTGEAFVPSISVTIAMLLALVGVMVLVYFIHHVATSIQVSTIVSSVAADTMSRIDSEYGKCERQPQREEPAAECRFELMSAHTGYLSSVDFDGLIDYAARHGLVVKMERDIGEFLIEGGLLALLSRRPDKHMTQALNRFFATGHYRTVEQDIVVGIQQLVDIALRALSPGINDTTTALLCIDYLSAIIARLAPLRVAPEHCYRDGKLLVQRCGPDFDELMGIAFDQVRHSAKDNLEVYLRLLTALEAIASHADGRRRKAILAQVALVQAYAGRNLRATDQLALLERRSLGVLTRLK